MTHSFGHLKGNKDIRFIDLSKIEENELENEANLYTELKV